MASMYNRTLRQRTNEKLTICLDRPAYFYNSGEEINNFEIFLSCGLLTIVKRIVARYNITNICIHNRIMRILQ